MGDTVRIQIRALSAEQRKRTFVKSIEARWSKELYKIRSKSKGTLLSEPEYRVEGLNQIFYRYQLLGPINPDNLIKITPLPTIQVIPRARGRPMVVRNRPVRRITAPVRLDI